MAEQSFNARMDVQEGFRGSWETLEAHREVSKGDCLLEDHAWTAREE